MSEDLAHRYETCRGNLLRRFLDLDGDELTDAEVLEMLLATSADGLAPGDLPRRLLTAFGSFAKVIHADARSLRAIDGMDEAMIDRLKLLRVALRHALRSEIDARPVIHCWQALMDYCRFTMGHNRVEEFHVLFLNHRHELLADELMQRGTINHAPVYPREVVRRALEHSAAAVILIHNHPSGDPTPSRADVDITRQIIEAAATIKVMVHDHVIVTKSGHYSFKRFGLMGDDPLALPEPAPTDAAQLNLAFPASAATPTPEVTP